MKKNDIEVSIVCNAYNHQSYIKDALDSFLMQKTNFKYEILIHDDASTDNTADIIREYEKKYPDIIKPIYQTENQYSQGKSILVLFQFSRVSGKYIAICEGDDYWTDPYKLQKQFDIMEKHPEINMCAHKATKVNAENKEIISYIEPAKFDTIFSPEQVIMGEGGFVATNSLFFRSKINEHIPPFRKMMSLDYTIQIHGSLNKGMYYINECMSAYRYMSANSWTSRMGKDNDKFINFQKRKVEVLNQLDIDTNFNYTETITERIRKNEFLMLQLEGKHKEALKPRYKKFIKLMPIKQRIKLVLLAYFPHTFKMIKSFKIKL